MASSSPSKQRSSTLRHEDEELLRGRRRFTADIAVDALEVVFVRSQVAHAEIVTLNISGACDRPGVVAVHTAETLGLSPFAHFPGLEGKQDRCPMARGKVRYVGEAVAMVIAETLAEAVDAAEYIEVELEPLTAMVDPRTSIDAEPLYETANTNVVHRASLETANVNPLDADTTTTIALEVRNNRVASAPMETDTIVVTPTSDGRLDIWCTSQGVHEIRNELARALELEPAHLRVRSPAVGGGFGGRANLPIEFIAVAKAALTSGETLRYVQSRWENLTSMPAGRDTHSRVTLTIDESGRFGSLGVDLVADAGAAAHMAGPLMASMLRQATGLYRFANLSWNGTAALTNTTPVGAYRGAGQPESNHARERAIDVAARRIGMDPIEIRRLNLLRRDELPFEAPGGVVYDVGDPLGVLDAALEAADIDGWRNEQEQRRAADADTALGIGVACYAQTSGRGNPADTALVRVTEQGRAEIACGSASHGQGHLTTMGTLVAERFGLTIADIDFIDSDSDAVDQALTTGGSRASQVLSTVLANASDDVLAQAMRIAATMLEASERDIVVEPASATGSAGLAVAGVPARRVAWSEIASATPTNCVEAIRSESTAGEAHPYGTHVSVVEVDLETGYLRLLKHIAADDCGVVLQPELVTGQQHGGSAAGFGQVLWENIGYDSDATPQNAFFATYGLPTAAELPFIETLTPSTRTDRNRLGTKGIGENGCNGAIASAHNAVCDALWHLGIEHIDLPLSPESVWRAINER